MHGSGRLAGLAVVGPFERSCGGVVVGDEAHDLGDEVVAGGELAAAQQPPGEDGEEQFD
jgi:hypothetical protein